HHLKLELVLQIVLADEPAQVERGDWPAFLPELPKKVGPPREAARLGDRAAARLHITVLLARKDQCERRLGPAGQHRLWTFGLPRGWPFRWPGRRGRLHDMLFPVRVSLRGGASARRGICLPGGSLSRGRFWRRSRGVVCGRRALSRSAR